MHRVAIVCCGGIGDSLLMMIAAKQWRDQGSHVTIFGDRVSLIAPLFRGYAFSPFFSLQCLEEGLRPFDVVIVQNDHSKRAHALFAFRKERREKGSKQKISFFFPTLPSFLSSEEDILFDPLYPMATNIAAATACTIGRAPSSWIKKKSIGGIELCLPTKLPAGFSELKQNGLVCLDAQKGSLEEGKQKEGIRVVMHPTSKETWRSWEQERYLQLSSLLQTKGFEIHFLMSIAERAKWAHVQKRGIFLPQCKQLKEAAACLCKAHIFIGNDSGLGHLASNLQVPTLTISPSYKRVRTWRPDWHIGRIVTPPIPLPNFKGVGWRFREKNWSMFVSVSRVLSAFFSLLQRSHVV